jgi:hypothetical protein
MRINDSALASIAIEESGERALWPTYQWQQIETRPTYKVVIEVSAQSYNAALRVKRTIEELWDD